MRLSKVFFVFLLLAVQMANAQDTTVTISSSMFDKFSDQLSLAQKGDWLFRPGNNPAWAQTGLDTTGWVRIKLRDLKKYMDKNGRVVGWFRMRVKFDSSLLHKKIWIDFASWAAMDLYIDGKLVATRGSTGSDGKPFAVYNGDQDPLSINFNSDTAHTFAIHFAGDLSPFPPHDLKFLSNSGDMLILVGPNPFINMERTLKVVDQFISTWLAVCAVLSLLFWLLAFENRREKNLIWIALCTSLYTVINFALMKENAIGLSYGSFYIYNQIGFFSVLLLLLISIPILLIKVFKRMLNSKLILFLLTLFLLSCLGNFFDISEKLRQTILIVDIVSVLFICIYYIISSWKRLKGAQWAIVMGLFLSLFTLCVNFGQSLINGSLDIYLTLILESIFILSFPLSLLVYVSIRFKEIIREVSINADRVVQLSEEKRAQAENQQNLLQEEVNRQTAEIRQTLDNLKATQKQLIQSEKMASLGELTAGIAHEIQNPLNFVNNFSEVNMEMITEMNEEIDKGNLSEVKNIARDIEANEEKINHHGKRADGIVKSMLEHSRSSNGVKEPTDINKLADEYLRLAYHGLRAKEKNFNASFETQFDKSIGKINIIPQDIGRVLLNLFNNAFYATNEKTQQRISGYEPKVMVSTRKIDGKIEIGVKDNGNGIPEMIKNKIFQPFFTTKPTGSGTGMGLSLSYDIMRAHNGEIKVESKEGEGTTFIIELPAV